MNNPKISVIVPVYNVEKYLCQCIDSILAQTFTDFELLIVDDGSTDRSGRICDEYADRDARIRVFHTANRGVSAARNLGIDNANGEWLCFVDSDDEVKHDYLKVFYECVDERYADLYVCGFDMLLKPKTSVCLPLAVYENERIQEFIIEAKKNGLLGVPWNKLFSFGILKDNDLHFDIDLWSYEDELFVLQYLKCCRSVMTFPMCTYVYHFGNVFSLSSQYIEIKEHIAIADALNKAGLQLNDKSDKYLAYLKTEYVRHLYESIFRLYWPGCRFNIFKRISIIKIVFECAENKNLTKSLKRQLHKGHFYFSNVFFLEVNGFLLGVYHWIKYSMLK